MKHAKKSINYQIRPAQLDEIPDILALFADEVEAGRMLPRTTEDLQAGIQDWRVVSTAGEVVGCVSLVFFNPNLCEIRSLAVAKSCRNDGLGKKLIEAALTLAKQRGVKEVLTLTRAAGLFKRCGFEINDIRNFPKKVQTDCQACPFIDCCDEVALLIKIEEKELTL